ncbi:MAG: diguanylate cyclase [marine bacterium B5-7]|nr:MAG: diguanylate cyclase [marine bacterium B5-7]
MLTTWRSVVATTAALTLLACANVQAADKIRIGSPYKTTTLDPMRSAAAGNIETYGQLYSRLLRLDESGELAPGLAESWEVSDDGTTITITMRDAMFSNGETITAEDAAFSLLRIRDTEESAYPAPLQTLDTAEAIDDKTLVLKLKSAFAPFLGNLEVFNVGIISKKDVEARGDDAFTADPVTSGPYMVEEWIPNERLVITPNPNYWRKGYPKNDGAELIEVVAENTRVSMMLSGELDAAREIPWSQVAELKANDSISMPLEPSTVIYMVLLNHARAPFNDIKIRQAAAMALDTPAITEAMTFGAATPANSTLPGALRFHDSELAVNTYDPEAAKAMLADSSYNGEELVILIADNPEREKVAVLMQAQWAAIGLKSKIEKVDGGTWWTRVPEGDYDSAPTWWYNETTDPDLAVRWAVCGSCGNRAYYTNYNNDEVNALVDEAAAELDESKRADMYRKIEKITTTEVAQIPLYYPPFANAYGDRVKGLSMTPALQWTLEGAEVVK